MKKHSQGVTPFLQNFEMNFMPVLFFYKLWVNKKFTASLDKCGEKSNKTVH